MRINFYKTERNFTTGRTDILKEKSINYSPWKKFRTLEAVGDFCRDVLQLHKATEEHAYVLCFDNALRLIGLFELAHGMANSVPVDVRALFTKLLLVSTEAFIFVHNHPSDDPLPSKEDKDLTETLWSVGKFLGIEMLDHVIISSEDMPFYSSMKELGCFENMKEILK